MKAIDVIGSKTKKTGRPKTKKASVYEKDPVTYTLNRPQQPTAAEVEAYEAKKRAAESRGGGKKKKQKVAKKKGAKKKKRSREGDEGTTKDARRRLDVKA